jgi:heme/copper-type cytochrome/quinol oxidase subunit 2
MNKLTMIIVSAVMMLGLALMPILPANALGDNCDDVSGTNLAACSACLAEDGAEWNAAGGPCTRPNGQGDATSIVQTIINVMLFIVGILSVIMIIFSGIRYITSAGDKSKTESAKNTLVYAVVGLVVAIVAFALVQWVFKALQ